MKKCVAVAVVLLALSTTTWGFQFTTSNGGMWLSTQNSAWGMQSMLWPQQSSFGACAGCGSGMLSQLAGSWLSDCDCGCGCDCGCSNPCGSGCGCNNPCGGCNNPCGGYGCSNPCGCGCDCDDDMVDPFDMFDMFFSF